VTVYSPLAQLYPRVEVAVVGEDADVVLVDDDPVIATLVKRVLTKQGYRVNWFPDGLAAVAALCKPSAWLQVKLILLDVSMPGMGGFVVLDRLRSDGVLDHSRVIMLTASVTEVDVRKAIGLGATGYLAKPLDVHLLQDRVQRVLGADRALA
jgi:CheY-like chemotaxis protein